jgi:hypothetical protein
VAGVLRVTRLGGILDRYRKWDVILDGGLVGSVANDRYCQVPVRSGKHTIRVGHRLLSSPLRTFNVGRSSKVEFVRRPRPPPMIWIPYGVASLV